jgi:hypothetical protein
MRIEMGLNWHTWWALTCCALFLLYSVAMGWFSSDLHVGSVMYLKGDVHTSLPGRIALVSASC